MGRLWPSKDPSQYTKAYHGILGTWTYCLIQSKIEQNQDLGMIRQISLRDDWIRGMCGCQKAKTTSDEQDVHWKFQQDSKHLRRICPSSEDYFWCQICAQPIAFLGDGPKSQSFSREIMDWNTLPHSHERWCFLRIWWMSVGDTRGGLSQHRIWSYL